MPLLKGSPEEKRKQALDFLLRPPLTFEKGWEEMNLRKAMLNAKVGNHVPNGDIYAGISPETGQRMYARRHDEKNLLDFNAAAKRAEDLSRETGENYRVPTINELKALFNNRAAIGNFTTGVWYWSSSAYNDQLARCQQMDDGKQSLSYKRNELFVRLVRS